MQEETDQRTLAGHINEWAGEGPVWCVRATMKAEHPVGPGGSESRRGSKHFAPGARLYLRRIMGFRNETDVADVEMVGRHRATHRNVLMIVRGSWLEGWRADLVYSPQVARLLWPKWDGTSASKEQAEWYAAFLNELSEQPHAWPLLISRFSHER